MNLVKRDEFEVLKKMVQKLIIESEKSNKTPKKRKTSKLIHDNFVKKRIKSISSKMLRRKNNYFLRNIKESL